MFSGIHPAKKPMEGGFSLDKFLPNLSPEDAEALGKMLDDMEAAKENGRKAADDAASALDLLSRVRFALGDNGTRMQADLIVYCAELREAKANLASAVDVAGKAGAERDRFRTALEYIRAELSSTPIAGDAWVGELHQRLFVVAHNAIN